MNTQSSGHSAVTDHLAYAESRCAKLEAIVYGVFGLAVLALLLGADGPAPTVPEQIEAQEFLVKDAQGALRARFGVAGSPETTSGIKMCFFDKQQRVRTEASYLDDSGVAGMTLRDRNGTQRVRFFTDDTRKNAAVVLFDERGAARAILDTDSGDKRVPTFALACPDAWGQVALTGLGGGGCLEVYNKDDPRPARPHVRVGAAD